MVASYDHAYDLVRAHGESGWTAHMVPLWVDGLIYASSMVMLDSQRRSRIRVRASACSARTRRSARPPFVISPGGCVQIMPI